MHQCEIDQTTGGRLHVLTRLMHRRMETVRAEYGMDCKSAPQGWLIHYLYDHRGEDVCQRDIERVFHIRRSSVTGMLQNMEKDGLITREAVAGDARLKCIRLTDRAIRQHEIIIRVIEQNEHDLTAGFTPEELATLHSLLDRMRQNLQDPKEESEPPC